jgi:hypothetical protein
MHTLAHEEHSSIGNLLRCKEVVLLEFETCGVLGPKLRAALRKEERRYILDDE